MKSPNVFAIVADCPKALLLPSVVVAVVVTPPLPTDGGMAEDHGAPEAGQLSGVWTRGRKETQNRQRVSGAKRP